MVDFILCPFCSCMFLTDADLELHLAHLGKNDVLHNDSFRSMHYEIELSYSREHGGADRIIRDIEAAILGYRAKRNE